MTDKRMRPGQADLENRVQKLLAGVILVVGLILLAFMVVVEDEPGALPLLLVLVGGGWILKEVLKTKRAR